MAHLVYQDVSVAGVRKGIKHEENGDDETTRSGLFFEAIRIIKEMRSNGGTTDNVRGCRYGLLENVCGLFSSNNGEDFATVLEEMARVAEPTVSLPRYEGGRWANAGAIIGNGWSIAFRTHDSQYWGRPQRRRRICVLADFDGYTAPEILFDCELRGEADLPGEIEVIGSSGDEPGSPLYALCKSLSGNPEQSGAQREGTAGDTAESSGSAVCGFPLGFRPENVRVYEETATTLCNGTRPGFTTGVISPEPVLAFRSYTGSRSYGMELNDDLSPVLTSAPGRNIPVVNDNRHKVFDARGNGDGRVVPTITGDHENRITDYTAVCVGNGQTNNVAMAEVSNTLDTMHDAQAIMENSGSVSVVRRLTPLECTRLQGFPDGWCDIGDWVDDKGKKHKEADAPKYRALGNSLCLPFWYWLLKRISDHCEVKTMGSLFDGISGFPLCWQMINGEGSCRWTSEIDPFCIAVAKKHFGDETTGVKGDWNEILFGRDKKADV